MKTWADVGRYCLSLTSASSDFKATLSKQLSSMLNRTVSCQWVTRTKVGDHQWSIYIYLIHPRESTRHITSEVDMLDGTTDAAMLDLGPMDKPIGLEIIYTEDSSCTEAP